MRTGKRRGRQDREPSARWADNPDQPVSGGRGPPGARAIARLPLRTDGRRAGLPLPTIALARGRTGPRFRSQPAAARPPARSRPARSGPREDPRRTATTAHGAAWSLVSGAMATHTSPASSHRMTRRSRLRVPSGRMTNVTPRTSALMSGIRPGRRSRASCRRDMTSSSLRTARSRTRSSSSLEEESSAASRGVQRAPSSRLSAE
jgi:hypothetical protein